MKDDWDNSVLNLYKAKAFTTYGIYYGNFKGSQETEYSRLPLLFISQTHFSNSGQTNPSGCFPDLFLHT